MIEVCGQKCFDTMFMSLAMSQTFTISFAILVYNDYTTRDSAPTCTSNVLMATGGNEVCCVGGVTLGGYRWPNVASAWATLYVACVPMGPSTVMIWMQLCGVGMSRYW